MFQLEVCVDSIEGADVAIRSGATRIELSDRLSVGGITPPKHLLVQALAASDVPIVALIRLRPGDFVYTHGEKQEMLRQCDEAIGIGVHAIAVGACKRNSKEGDDELDWEFLESVADRFSGVELVVHRAFDRIIDPFGTAARLRSIGYDRILTSGGAESAEQGVEVLHQLQSSGQIEILPAGGIGSHNAAKILTTTGCTQLHGSFRKRFQGVVESNSMPDPDEIAQVLLAFQHR